MRKPERTFIIVNSKAKNGRAGKERGRLERIIREEFRGEFHAELTSDAVETVKAALRVGATKLSVACVITQETLAPPIPAA